jgi:hypothetical protein
MVGLRKGLCYRWDLECPPNAHVLKVQSSAWHYCKGLEPLRGGLTGRKLGHWDYALEGILGSWPILVLLFYLIAPKR